jgi:hypothetical protein
MIYLQINCDKVPVPTIKEVTTASFLKLQELKSFNLIDYFSIVLGYSRKKSSDLVVKNPNFLAEQLYGDIPNYELSAPKKRIVINGTNYKLSDDFTIGERIVIEESGRKMSETDLLILILAVACDSEKYSELIPLILNSPAHLVLPEAFFLLRNLSHGKQRGANFIRRFRRIMIQIKSLRNRLA